jgi:hypothetical protein
MDPWGIFVPRQDSKRQLEEEKATHVSMGCVVEHEVTHGSMGRVRSEGQINKLHTI